MNITEVSNFDANVYLIDLLDPVEGGVTGIDNKQGIALANRTRWLYDQLTPLLGKQFFNMNVVGPVTVSNNTLKFIDGSTYALTYPISTPFYTTPNDGTTRTYRVTVSAAVASFPAGVGNIQLVVYTTTAGPTQVQKIAVNVSYSYDIMFFTKILTLGPNVALKAYLNNNATGGTGTFSDLNFTIDEV